MHTCRHSGHNFGCIVSTRAILKSSLQSSCKFAILLTILNLFGIQKIYYQEITTFILSLPEPWYFNKYHGLNHGFYKNIHFFSQEIRFVGASFPGE